MPEQFLYQIDCSHGCNWVGICEHGTEAWEIHRRTEYAARRSLEAHVKHEHAESGEPA